MDLGSPTHTFESYIDNLLVNSTIILCQLANIFVGSCSKMKQFSMPHAFYSYTENRLFNASRQKNHSKTFKRKNKYAKNSPSTNYKHPDTGNTFSPLSFLENQAKYLHAKTGIVLGKIPSPALKI
jgi:hypothetical protein